MTVIPIPEITTDGAVVWVNSMYNCIGRFGKFGIDIHDEEARGCLFCTHAAVTAADWETFKEKMLKHHGVVVSDEFKPTRFQ